jgi:hypothetical protein
MQARLKRAFRVPSLLASSIEGDQIEDVENLADERYTTSYFSPGKTVRYPLEAEDAPLEASATMDTPLKQMTGLISSGAEKQDVRQKQYPPISVVIVDTPSKGWQTERLAVPSVEGDSVKSMSLKNEPTSPKARSRTDEDDVGRYTRLVHVLKRLGYNRANMRSTPWKLVALYSDQTFQDERSERAYQRDVSLLP